MNLLLARLRNRGLRLRLKHKKLPPPARRNLTALDHLKGSQKAVSYNYVVLDLETTGLDLNRDRVISVGAFRMVQGRIRLGDMFNELVNPGREISTSSIKVHGIVPDMVAQAPPPREVLERFLEYLGVDILVAHHARFDLHFLNQFMRQRYGFCLQNLVIDTVLLSQALKSKPAPYPYGFGIRFDQGMHSLDSLARDFGLTIHQRHTALGDALTAAMIFQRLLARMEDLGMDRLSHLVRLAALF